MIDCPIALLCLQEQAQCRDSRSTISGRGGVGAYDYLGRPVLHNNSRRGRDRLLDRDEESRLRVESYVRNSNMSLVSIYQGKLRPDFSKLWNVSHPWHDPLCHNWFQRIQCVNFAPLFYQTFPSFLPLTSASSGKKIENNRKIFEKTKEII